MCTYTTFCLPIHPSVGAWSIFWLLWIILQWRLMKNVWILAVNSFGYVPSLLTNCTSCIVNWVVWPHPLAASGKNFCQCWPSLVPSMLFSLSYMWASQLVAFDGKEKKNQKVVTESRHNESWVFWLLDFLLLMPSISITQWLPLSFLFLSSFPSFHLRKSSWRPLKTI